MNIEEKDQGEAIQKAGRWLAHFHACGSDRGTPGNDHIDWKPIARASKRLGNRADVIIESFTTDVKVSARASAIWRRIEPTRDEIATKGIKFLKRALKKESRTVSAPTRRNRGEEQATGKSPEPAGWKACATP